MGNYLDDRLHRYSEETFLQLSAEERNNRTFVMKCLARNGRLYQVLSDDLKGDLEIKMTAVRNDETVVYLFGKNALLDIDFAMQCVSNNGQVYPLLPIEVRSHPVMFEWALKAWGVDAFWGMPLEYFKSVPYMVKALKGHNGKNKGLWDAILSGAGDEAYFSKVLIEEALLVFGKGMMGMDFKTLLHKVEIRERVRKALPDESLMVFFESTMGL